MSHQHYKQRLKALSDAVRQLQPDFSLGVIFISTSDGQNRAKVHTVRAKTLDGCLENLIERPPANLKIDLAKAKHIRLDIPKHVETTTIGQLNTVLKDFKRNYFPFGLSWDKTLDQAFLCEELLANAILYPGGHIKHAQLNVVNLNKYARQKWGSKLKISEKSDQVIHLFNTSGFYSASNEDVYVLNSNGHARGLRVQSPLNAETCLNLICSASEYLARQVKADGSFVYGHFPCFGQTVNGYNTLRHASSIYAMLEALEVNPSKSLDEAITRALRFLVGKLIRVHWIKPNVRMAFLIDIGDEIKLGGNAVALLALCKYTQLKQDLTYLPLMKDLANGIAGMQNQTSGQFIHVLNYPSLSVKEQFRIIYYDGEAAFALMRLHELNPKLGCLQIVEKAFQYFLKADHANAHDHWLSYCVNELTRHKPEFKYFQFGINNFVGHLEFVRNRITTFPTLLELMMAAHHMILRMRHLPQYKQLLDQVDQNKFYEALHHRANHLLTGFFWPELAMFFQTPDSIDGSFFIRHHSFRVRIDDIEHYISGLIAYRQALLSNSLPSNGFN